MNSKKEKEEQRFSDEEEYQYLPIHQNKPFWDFKYAVEEYGFDFLYFSNNNFEDFIKTKFLNELVLLRTSFQQKDLRKIEIFSHNLKGSFK